MILLNHLGCLAAIIILGVSLYVYFETKPARERARQRKRIEESLPRVEVLTTRRKSNIPSMRNPPPPPERKQI